MPYYDSSKQVKKYRLIVQELQTWNEHPDAEEMKLPRTAGSSEPKARAREEWIETDHIETASKAVAAGILRAKADELDPPSKTTYRSYDAER